MFLYLKSGYPTTGQLRVNEKFLRPIEVAMTPEDNDYDPMKMGKRSEVGLQMLPNRKTRSAGKPLQVGFQMLPNRQIRFAGKTLQGVILPRETSSKISLIKMLLARYGPCIEAQEGGHQLNEECFTKKENEFLKLMDENLTKLKFKYVI